MPVIITETPSVPIPLAPPRKRWTRYECEQLAATGLLDMEPLELIEGELINKMGKNPPHIFITGELAEWFRNAFGYSFLRLEGSINVAPEDNPSNHPEPDLCLLNRPRREFLFVDPSPSDIRMVAEVSDSTLQFDSTAKARLYARAGILEYWIIDVNSRKVIVHRAPLNGVYTSVAIYTENEPICPLGAPQAEFRAVTVLPEVE